MIVAPGLTQTFFYTPVDSLFNTLQNTPFKTLFDTPYQTLFESPFQTLFSTLESTPVFTLSPSQTLTSGKQYSKSVIAIITTEISIMNISTTTTNEKGEVIVSYYTLFSQFEYTITKYIDVIIDVQAEDGENNGNGLSSSMVIIIAIIGGLLLLCISVVAVFIYRKSTNSSSEDVESSNTDELFDNDNIPQHIPFPEEEEFITKFDNTKHQSMDTLTTTDVGTDDSFAGDDNYIDQFEF